jgi:transglutaminase/protease-like cytokinesis protein 3
MKPAAFILCVLISLKPAAQNNSVNPIAIGFAKVDKYAVTVDAVTTAELSKKLTAPFQTDREKIRAIFRWVAENISYKTSVKKGLKKQNYFSGYITDDSSELKPLDERVAEMILQNREAFCDGYSRLFKSLCDYSAIPSVLITGYGKTESGIGKKKFRSNHTWNAVFADSAWHLLDVTWASGFLYYNNPDFIKQFNDYYFFTPPEKFIQDHQPDDLRWSLLNKADIPAIWEYNQSPFRTKSFLKYSIISYSPAKGVIEVESGDTVRFEVERDRQSRRISSDSLWEDNELLHNFSFIKPDQASDKKIIYTYIAEAGKSEWLHLMYNDDAVLRYRIKIRNRLVKE